MTPSDGRLSKYRAEIRMKMLMNAKRNRKYPNMSIGDKVRLFRKKIVLSKKDMVYGVGIYTLLKI